MKSEEKNILLIVGLTSLLFITFTVITGKAGNLEPTAPPQPTMVTLDQISAQIAALSSPIGKVVRGVITFPDSTYGGGVELSQAFSPAVDPNRSLVMLSPTVTSENPGADSSWVARTGACLIELTETQITVRVEPLPVVKKVSYQIIEYK